MASALLLAAPIRPKRILTGQPICKHCDASARRFLSISISAVHRYVLCTRPAHTIPPNLPSLFGWPKRPAPPSNRCFALTSPLLFFASLQPRMLRLESTTHPHDDCALLIHIPAGSSSARLDSGLAFYTTVPANFWSRNTEATSSTPDAVARVCSTFHPLVSVSGPPRWQSATPRLRHSSSFGFHCDFH